MIHVHFLINKLDIEHIIALGGKKSHGKFRYWARMREQ